MAVYYQVKGPVGYTVVGSPTIVDGIASGFSSSSYLQISQTYNATNNKNVEIYVRAKTPSTISSGFNPILTSESVGYWGISSYANALFTIRMGYSDGKILQFEDMYIRGGIQPDTWYRFKITGNNGIWRAEIYSDSGTLLNSADKDWTSNTVSANYTLYIRCTDYTGTYSGSIDLKETYIKVNAEPWFGVCPVEVQKHQVRGPVGYSVVGNPTIVDGIVSGFSNSDYLQLNQIVGANDARTFEISTKFTTPSTFTRGGSIVGISTFHNYGIRISSYTGTSAALAGQVYSNSTYSTVTSGTSSLQPNTTYYCRFLVDFENGTLNLQLSTDGTNWASYTGTCPSGYYNASQINWRIGTGVSNNADYGYSACTIDLNETYIKVNGKLWFWQPQESKYIVKDGKLVWADPRIYLEGTGTQGITTDIYPNSNYTLEAKIYTIPLSTNGVNNAIIDSTTIGRLGFMYRSANNNQNVIWYAYFPETRSSWNYFNYNQAYVLKTVKDASNTYFYINGVLDLTLPIEEFTSSSVPLQMWRKDPGSSVYPVGRIYYTKVWNDEGKLVGHFVPVPTGLQIGNFTVPSNGMFDMVNQQFYANKGTGVFAIGRDE